MTRFKFRSLQTSSWYTCIFYVPAVIMVKAYTCLIIHNTVNSNITLFSQAHPWYHQIKIFFQISIRTINWAWTYRYLLLFCELKEVWGKRKLCNNPPHARWYTSHCYHSTKLFFRFWPFWISLMCFVWFHQLKS